MPSISSKLVAAAAAATLLAGCSTEGPAENALATASEDHETTTTVAPSAAVPEELAFDEEQAALAADLMETEEGRQLVIATMAEQLGLELSQAECFVDNTPTEAMAGLADNEMTSDEITLFLGVLTECDIELSDLGILATPDTLSSGTDSDAEAKADGESVPD